MQDPDQVIEFKELLEMPRFEKLDADQLQSFFSLYTGKHELCHKHLDDFEKQLHVLLKNQANAERERQQVIQIQEARALEHTEIYAKSLEMYRKAPTPANYEIAVKDMQRATNDIQKSQKSLFQKKALIAQARDPWPRVSMRQLDYDRKSAVLYQAKVGNVAPKQLMTEKEQVYHQKKLKEYELERQRFMSEVHATEQE